MIWVATVGNDEGGRGSACAASRTVSATVIQTYGSTALLGPPSSSIFARNTSVIVAGGADGWTGATPGSGGRGSTGTGSSRRENMTLSFWVSCIVILR